MMDEQKEMVDQHEGDRNASFRALCTSPPEVSGPRPAPKRGTDKPVHLRVHGGKPLEGQLATLFNHLSGLNTALADLRQSYWREIDFDMARYHIHQLEVMIIAWRDNVANALEETSKNE